MIYKGTTKAKIYKGDYKPFNIYKGSTKLGGWKNDTQTGTELTFTDTYKDTATLTNISGSSSQLTIASGSNKVVNGNFVDTTGWTANSATISASGNVLTVTATAKWGSSIQTFSTVVGRKYYACVTITGTTANFIQFIGNKYATSTTRQKLRLIATATSTSHIVEFGDNRASGWTPFTVEQAFVVDLTALFGAGNEPTLAWCDVNLTYDRVTNGTPSPTSSSTIYSSGDEGNINIFRHKKNLFTLDNKISGASITKLSTNSYSVSSDGLWKGLITVKCDVKKNTNYYFKYYSSVGSNTYYLIRNEANTATIDERYEQYFRTFNSGENEYINIRLYASGSTSYTGEVIFYDIQLEEGTTPTTFEAYNGTEYPITVSQPLRSLPNGVKDTIDNGVLTRRVGKVVLNGSESLGKNTYITGADVYGYQMNTELNNIKLVNVSPIGYMSDRFLSVSSSSWNANNEHLVQMNNKTLLITINKSRLTTGDANDFKSWLASNNVTVLYELATPTTENVTVPSIDTFEDYTIISTTNTVKPSLTATTKVIE